MTDTIQKAAVKYLLTVPEVVASVGKFTLTQVPFIFRDEMLVNLEDGKYSAISAIVVEDGGPIAQPAITRFRARRLRVTIWGNGTRDGMGNLVDPASVEDVINETFLVLDKFLHRTDPASVMWAGIQTISCDRIGDISEPVSITDGDGIKIATVNYAVGF